MAIIPKVGSGGEKFDIINGIRKQFSAVGADVEKHTFVEKVSIGPITSNLASIITNTVVIIYEDENTVFVSDTDDKIFAIRNNNGNIISSNLLTVPYDVKFVGNLDSNRWLLRDESSLFVLKLNGKSLTKGTALAVTLSTEVNYIVNSSYVFGFIPHDKGYSGYESPPYVEAIFYTINDTVISAGKKITIFEEVQSSLKNAEILYMYPTENNGGTVLVSTYRSKNVEKVTAVHVSISGSSITKGTALSLGSDYYSIGWTCRLDSNSFMLVDEASYYCYAVMAVGNVLYASSLNIPEYPPYLYNVDNGISLVLSNSASNHIWSCLVVRNGNAASIIESKTLGIGSLGLTLDKVIPLGDNLHRIFYRVNSRCAAADITVSSTSVTLLRHKQASQLLNEVEFIGETGNVGVYSDTYSDNIVYITPEIDNINIVIISNAYPPPSQEDRRTCMVYTKNCLWTIYGDYVSSQSYSYYLIYSFNVNEKNKKYSANYAADHQYYRDYPIILMAIETGSGIQFASLERFEGQYYVVAKKFIADENGNVSVPGTGVRKSTKKIEGVTEEKIFQGNLGNVLVLDTEE